jgi:LPS sulfotransferase NodH
MPKTKFAIVTIPRTGSNYLCGLLNSHREILCHHELFHKDAIYYSLDHREDLNLGTVESRDKNPLGFLESIWANSYSAKAVGFKIFPDHNDMVLAEILKNKGIKIIILERPALLSAFVSAEIAKKTGIYSSLQGEGRIDGKIYVKQEEFKDFIIKTNDFFLRCKRILTLMDKEFLVITYPEILRSHTIKKILLYLGTTSDAKLYTPHKKQRDYTLEGVISNYQELIDDFGKTEFGKYLH